MIEFLLVIEYGLILIILSILFWNRYGRPVKNIKLKKNQSHLEIECFRWIPITTLIIFLSVAVVYILIFNEGVRSNIFDDLYKPKNLIIELLGTIFTGFILMITIFWALRGSKIKMLENVHYFQSLLIVLLFFFIVVSFYYLLLL